MIVWSEILYLQRVNCGYDVLYCINFFPDYRLVIICSNEKEDMSHVISRLHKYKCHFMASQIDDVEKYRKYFVNKFTALHQSDDLPASQVDHEK